MQPSLPSSHSVYQNSISSDLEKQSLMPTRNWLGREVEPIPTSYTTVNIETSASQKGGGAACCVLAIVCVIAGGVMWGVCADPTLPGCNEAIKKAGQALTFTGIGIIGLGFCLVGTLCCCGLVGGAGLALANRS